MHTQWIEHRTVQRVSLREGLVLDLDDYNELVITRPMRLTLPPLGPHPEEQVLIDPDNVTAQERPLLDLAGAVCTRAWCDDDGTLHFGLLARAPHRRRPRRASDVLGAVRQTPRLHGVPATRPGTRGASRPARRRK